VIGLRATKNVASNAIMSRGIRARVAFNLCKPTDQTGGRRRKMRQIRFLHGPSPRPSTPWRRELSVFTHCCDKEGQRKQAERLR